MKLLQTVKSIGLANALLYWSDRILSRLSWARVRVISYYLLAQQLPSSPLLKPGKGTTILVVELDNEKAERLIPRDSSVLKQRYGQNSRCLAAFVEEVMVGFIWFTLGPYQEDEVCCTYVPGDDGAWDYDLWIEPKYRVSFVFVRLWDAAIASMRAKQRFVSFSRVSAFNQGSLAAHKRMGAKVLGKATFFKVGNVQLMLSDLRPRLHFCVTPRSQPILAVGSKN